MASSEVVNQTVLAVIEEDAGEVGLHINAAPRNATSHYRLMKRIAQGLYMDRFDMPAGSSYTFTVETSKERPTEVELGEQNKLLSFLTGQVCPFHFKGDLNEIHLTDSDYIRILKEGKCNCHHDMLGAPDTKLQVTVPPFSSYTKPTEQELGSRFSTSTVENLDKVPSHAEPSGVSESVSKSSQTDGQVYNVSTHSDLEATFVKQSSIDGASSKSSLNRSPPVNEASTTGTEGGNLFRKKFSAAMHELRFYKVVTDNHSNTDSDILRASHVAKDKNKTTVNLDNDEAMTHLESGLSKDHVDKTNELGDQSVLSNLSISSKKITVSEKSSIHTVIAKPENDIILLKWGSDDIFSVAAGDKCRRTLDEAWMRASRRDITVAMVAAAEPSDSMNVWRLLNESKLGRLFGGVVSGGAVANPPAMSSRGDLTREDLASLQAATKPDATTLNQASGAQRGERTTGPDNILSGVSSGHESVSSYAVREESLVSNKVGGIDDLRLADKGVTMKGKGEDVPAAAALPQQPNVQQEGATAGMKSATSVTDVKMDESLQNAVSIDKFGGEGVAIARKPSAENLVSPDIALEDTQSGSHVSHESASGYPSKLAPSTVKPSPPDEDATKKDATPTIAPPRTYRPAGRKSTPHIKPILGSHISAPTVLPQVVAVRPESTGRGDATAVEDGVARRRGRAQGQRDDAAAQALAEPPRRRRSLWKRTKRAFTRAFRRLRRLFTRRRESRGSGGNNQPPAAN